MADRELRGFFNYLVESGRAPTTAVSYLTRVKQVMRALGGFETLPGIEQIEQYVRSLPAQHRSMVRSSWRALIEYGQVRGIELEPLPAGPAGRPGRPPLERIAQERDRLAYALAEHLPMEKPEAVFWVEAIDCWRPVHGVDDKLDLKLSPLGDAVRVPWEFFAEFRHVVYPDLRFTAPRPPGSRPLDAYLKVYDDVWLRRWRRRNPDRGDWLELKERVERAFAAKTMVPWTIEEARTREWCQRPAVKPQKQLVAGVDYIPFDQADKD